MLECCVAPTDDRLDQQDAINHSALRSNAETSQHSQESPTLPPVEAMDHAQFDGTGTPSEGEGNQKFPKNCGVSTMDGQAPIGACIIDICDSAENRTAANKRILQLLPKDTLIELLADAADKSEEVAQVVDKTLEMHPLCHRLMVRNISFSTENTEFQDTFSKLGPVEDSTVVRDKETKRSKGFGFITFKRVDAVRKALCSLLILGGRELQIKLAAADTNVDQVAQRATRVPPESTTLVHYASTPAGDMGDVRGALRNGAQPRKLFIRNLSQSTTKEQLRLAFEEYGAVENCVVVKDYVHNRSKGYGFVTFAKSSDASVALQSGTKMIDGQSVYVSYAWGASQQRALLNNPNHVNATVYDSSYMVRPFPNQYIASPTTVKPVNSSAALYPYIYPPGSCALHVPPNSPFLTTSPYTKDAANDPRQLVTPAAPNAKRKKTSDTYQRPHEAPNNRVYRTSSSVHNNKKAIPPGPPPPYPQQSPP